MDWRAIVKALNLGGIPTFDPVIDRVDSPVKVPTTGWDFDAIRERAERRAAEMVNSNHSYAAADPDRNEVGLLGEQAVITWLLEGGQHVTDISDEPQWRRHGDIRFVAPRRGNEVPVARTIEVKTNQYAGWRNYGRTLPEQQFRRSLATVFLWCVIEEELPPSFLTIMGWLPRTTIEVAPTAMPPASVRVVTPMRPPGSLIEWVSASGVG